ncbi:15_t:CDS:2 [Diversispora eburnea]|uniref:15_t:CDS:1 n=1 Tax=Diversispora eburnea TaxID=1213867 RepID=A0A9N9FHT0_9GLOM|nr:15_t:CDS:2 [Diversispora eburnea]
MELDFLGNELAESESLDVTFLSGHIARNNANSNHSRVPAQICMVSNIASSTIQSEFDSWKLSNKLKKLYNHFNNTVLNQFPCVPYIFPNVSLCFHPNSEIEKIALCKSCTIDVLFGNNTSQTWYHPILLTAAS